MNKVARQRIVDRNGNLFGYELLYRGNNIENHDESTLNVIMNSLFNIGYNNISDNSKLFVNFADSDLMTKVAEVISPNIFAFEVLEHVLIDKKFVSKIKLIKEKGFTIALDDFHLRDIKDIDVYNYVDIIKVDFMDTGLIERKLIETLAKEFSISLLAEKVETIEEYNYAQKRNYSFIQGYYINKPELIEFVVSDGFDSGGAKVNYYERV